RHSPAGPNPLREPSPTRPGASSRTVPFRTSAGRIHACRWVTVRVARFVSGRHAMNSTILAIDLGKYNSVLCWYQPEDRNAAFRTVATTPEVLRHELTGQAVAPVVFEACSQAGWVHDLCAELGLAAVVASTTGSAWQ